MYWPEEDSVSVVKQENVVLPPVFALKCGKECSVKIRGKTYLAKCMEIGENAFNYVNEESLLNSLVLVLISSTVHV